ncbi:hypothetical protein OAJ65_01085 [Flavobacteriales bacterium]|nr:hypothetical protein [Flavobacteriales bacterium]
MNNIFNWLKEKLIVLISTALTFLCLGVIIQLLIGDDILGWDPVGNIQRAGSAFIGVIAFVLLYLLYNKK